MAEINKKELAAKKARKAQKEMLAYMQEHNLDPKKDWITHKKHGKKIQAWIDIINLGNKKSRELNEEKAIEKLKAKKDKKPEVHPKVKKVDSTPNSYDYPQVDGKEMSSLLKKRYRAKMRTLLKTKKKEEAEKIAKECLSDWLKSESKSKASIKESDNKPIKKDSKPKKEVKEDKKPKANSKNKIVKSSKKVKEED